MSRIRLIYVVIPIAVSAFAAYGSVYLLFVNAILLPIFFRRKEDFLTPILAVTAAIFSFVYISNTIPVIIDSGTETLSLTWSDNSKIDGGSIKGFAKTTSGETIYAIYKFETEEEKLSFTESNLPSIQFTLTGSFRAADIPSHAYSFNMVSYMRMYGASGIFESEEILEVSSKSTLAASLAGQRRRVKEHIQRVFPESLVAEAEALLIGDRSGMDDEEATIYRRLGITHLFAISGLHVGLLAFMLRELLLRLKIRRETVSMVLIFLLPFYAVLAGGAPSVWRAVSVTVLVLVTTFSRVRIRLDNAIAFSAIVFILYQPFVLFQPGFQLSYIAAISLVLSSQLLARTKTVVGTSFLVTSISQLSLYPLLLFHFHELSLSSFFINIIYVPLYSVIILPINIILLIGSVLYLPFTAVLFNIYVPVREFIRLITSWVSSLPYQLWTPGKPGAIEATFAVVGVLYFFLRYEEGKLLRYCLSFAVVPALLIQFLPYTDGTLRVTYLDVGQGDSAVIELPYRRGVYVIDTGGIVGFGVDSWKTPTKPFEVGRKIVVPYLKGRGITKIDKLIISHAHADHMEGADEVVEEIRVTEIHIAPGSKDEKEMEELVQAANDKKVPIHEMGEGVSWTAGSASFAYIGPPDGEYVGNDSSLVLLMKTTGPSFLFTGDMEQASEEKFVRKYGRVKWGELILKAGHHGSKTSSTDAFVDLLRPQLTIISAGRNNLYGHPHQEVLDTFAKYDIPTLLTADKGSITIVVEKNRYAVVVSQE